MASTAVARRSTKAKLARTQARLAKLKNQITESRAPQALMQGGLVLGGAAACGALRATVGEEIAGVDSGVVAGLVSATAGIALKQYWLVPLGAGLMSPYTADFVQDAIGGFMDKGEAAPTLREVGAE